MEKSRPDSQIRADAFGLIAPLYKEDKFRGYNAGIGIFESLGATSDEAEEMMAELSLTLDHNELPGGIINLPEFDPETPITPELIKNTPMLRETALFTLGYVEDATTRNDHSAIYLGESWLGNSSKETQELLDNFQSNPSSVSHFLRWSFDNDPSIEDILTEFEEKAANNLLRPPSFE